MTLDVYVLHTQIHMYVSMLCQNWIP